MASLRDKQIASIKRLLNLNSPLIEDAQDDAVPNTSTDSAAWRILVMDDAGRDVISSVLRVADLRHAGITVHLNINTKRQPIPDAPVIYLVQPTLETLKAITYDLSNGLYSPAYINFISSIPRPLLEEFGAMAVAEGATDRIASVHDQHLEFVVAEPDLFHLSFKKAYHTLNSPQTTESQIDDCMNRIVNGLFSVVVTMSVVPVIRCPKGGAAEQISARLDRRLRDHLLNSKMDKSSVASRPVLLVVDRNVDLVPMFSHTWIYQSLVNDVLECHLNKITIPVPVDPNHPEKGVKKQSYDLTASDYFWARNASKPFPVVAEDVTNEWAKYQQEAEAITKRTGTTSLDEISGAAHLKGALALLPELRERKATIEMHMSILEAVMQGIKNRKIDSYFQLEEELTKKSGTEMLRLIQSADMGDEPHDKLRLFLQWYLTTEQEVSPSDFDQFTEALASAGVETAPVQYVKTVRQLTRLTMMASAPAQPQSNPASQIFGGFSSLSSRVSERFKDAGITNMNMEGVLSGIKNFLPKNTDSTLTKLLESLMDPQAAASSAIAKTEGYLYFDPRSANARGALPPASQSRNQQSTVGRGIDATFGQRRQVFNEAIVFPVGGGSMDEYGNLMEWAQRTSASQGAAGTGQKRRIIYGSTAIYRANDFIKEDLTQLGREST